MKNMRLSNLRKKTNNYYKKIGVVKPDGKRSKTIEYIVERTFESLPKTLKSYIEDDKYQLVKVITNTIIQSGRQGEMNPYEALKQTALYKQKRSGANTKSYIYRIFREEESSLYAKYNSYVYRLGYSSSKYFLDNAEVYQKGSIIVAVLDLPEKGNGVIYETLHLEYDFSAQEMLEAYME